MTPPVLQIRELLISDYDAAIELWQQVDGVEVTEGDGRDEISKYLARNPGLSRAADEGGKLVGAALCGHDARRGWIYHLAVAPTHRGRGIAKLLVGECIAGLRAVGIRRAIILVADDNAAGHAFWQRNGWEEIDGAIAMSIDV